MAVLWTIFMTAVPVWHCRRERTRTYELARVQARSAIEKDIVYRQWAAERGGVYVPANDKTPPNPFLGGHPERDLVTPSGRRLTLVNPAYMTRQVHELGLAEYGLHAHLTSLKPLRPENAPDVWEATALALFEGQTTEVSGIETIDGQPYMRLMQPLVMQKGCMGCHEGQGYRIGDIRGGLSAAVPMGAMLAETAAHNARLAVCFTAIWLIGLGALGLVLRVLGSRLRERRMAQAALCAANTELALSREKAEMMAEEAVRANQAKSEFLANMSHEIRTPMNAILGFSDLLTTEELTETQAEYIGIIHQAGRNLLELINQVLDLSKIEAGKYKVAIEECPIRELLDGLGALMAPLAGAKGVAFEIRTEDDVPGIVRTDGGCLRHCLTNLIANAIKFTDHGHVHVRVGLDEGDGGRRLRFDVEDTGIGIPPDMHERIFESFTQADGSSTRRHGGTGLGLTLTRKFARLLGGDVSVTSSPGNGALFTLYIPLKSAVAAGGDTGFDEPHSEAALQVQTRFGGTVLVVDDDRASQTLLRLTLERLGFDVDTAATGAEAVEKVRDRAFAMIFMDMQMPEMNGYEAAARIRRMGAAAPIIAVTAHAMHGDRDKCIASGCDDYLSKPFDRERLRKIVQMHLAAAPLLAVASTPSCT